MNQLDRRSFLRYSGLAGAGAAAGGTGLLRLFSGAAGAATAPYATGTGPYGRLVPMPAVNEPAGPAYLALPEGFRYVKFGETGALMADGVTRFGQNHDGMGAFVGPRGTVRLTRNQEDRALPGLGSVQGPEATRYDPLGGGGVTVLDFDTRTGRLENSFIGLNGTIVNCAGGLAFQRSGWLTCEETVAGPEDGWGRKHGYVFFLPAKADSTVPAVPLTALGRFSHEAAFAGRTWGTIYLTEDGGSGRGSGFYRFQPTDRRDLTRGGRLQMLAVAGRPQADLREGQSEGRVLETTWVDIDDPDPDVVIEAELPGATSCFAQGWAGGGAKFNRLEGLWLAQEGGGFLFASTSGGDVKNGDVNDDGFEEGYGQIWRYLPRDDHGGRLVLEFESPGGSVLDSPDNLTQSPRGGILLCEDDAGSGDGDTHPLAPGITDVNRLVGLTTEGTPFEFAVNCWSDSEWAGACYSPDRRTLFANVFGGSEPGSGFTVAITGPWGRGAL